MKLKWLDSVPENKASWTLMKYLIFVENKENKVSGQVIAYTTLTVLYFTGLSERESSETENTWFESQLQNRNWSPSHRDLLVMRPWVSLRISLKVPLCS